MGRGARDPRSAQTATLSVQRTRELLAGRGRGEDGPAPAWTRGAAPEAIRWVEETENRRLLDVLGGRRARKVPEPGERVGFAPAVLLDSLVNQPGHPLRATVSPVFLERRAWTDQGDGSAVVLDADVRDIQ